MFKGLWLGVVTRELSRMTARSKMYVFPPLFSYFTFDNFTLITSPF